MRAAMLALALGACAYEHEFKAVDGGPPLPHISFVGGVGADVGEGMPATITAYLDGAAPMHDVTVAVLSADPAKIQVDTPTIQFPLASWRDLQLIHVTALQDDDAVDDLAHIELYSPDAIGARFQLDIRDDDVQAIVLSASAVDVNEGGSTTLDVHLAAQPISPLTVQVASLAPSQNPIEPVTLVFDASSWKTAQTVTIWSTPDSNTISENTALRLSSTVTAPVDVTIHNHDTGP